MKIEITCIDAMCLAFLAENMSVIDPEFEAFYCPDTFDFMACINMFKNMYPKCHITFSA